MRKKVQYGFVLCEWFAELKITARSNRPDFFVETVGGNHVTYGNQKK